jgi:hypothetical protein
VNIPDTPEPDAYEARKVVPPGFSDGWWQVFHTDRRYKNEPVFSQFVTPFGFFEAEAKDLATLLSLARRIREDGDKMAFWRKVVK